MKGSVELQWLQDEGPLKDALKRTLGCSGQLLKRHLTSKELSTSQGARRTVRLPLDLVNHLQINPEYQGPQARIITETKDYLAVHKPHGIHSHPHSYDDKDTILNFLVHAKFWAPLQVNTEAYDRGLLYRLDLETSGVMVLAKNQEFFNRMRGGFHTAVKRKLYWAIVEGHFDQVGEHTHFFEASGIKGMKQKVSDTHGNHEGKLSVWKLLESEGRSLVLVDLGSGLRHQIRAQLAHLGFPLLGDELYGGKKAERLFLHALRYEWEEIVEDTQAELFGRFFDMDRALQVGHDMVRGLKGC
jgi:23S rRNA pseudouridine1911/1915/1917 synthase